MANYNKNNQPTGEEITDICRIYEAVMGDPTLADALGRIVSRYISPSLMQDIRLCMMDAKLAQLTARLAALETANTTPTTPEN